MPAKKPKVTVGPDGTIHVEGENKSQSNGPSSNGPSPNGENPGCMSVILRFVKWFLFCVVILCALAWMGLLPPLPDEVTLVAVVVISILCALDDENTSEG